MHDAYAGLNRLYLSMHSPDAVAGHDINDPVMSAWIADHLPVGGYILDAGCGLGFDVVAMHRGLPARQTGKQFIVFGCDYSPDMLSTAISVGEMAGIPADRYRVASFAALADIGDWQGRMDAVAVNYALYTLPPATDYDAYLHDCLLGLRSVLRIGGNLVANLRDWSSLMRSEAAGGEHTYANVHNGDTYHCRYSWRFGGERIHGSTLTMWDDHGNERSTDILFAERSLDEVSMALTKAGFAVRSSGRHGDGAYAFDTVIAERTS